jgi:tRNA threonylcarbamoyladenosine biosynthesis protein TsaE
VGQFEANSEEETREFGKRLAKQLPSQGVVLLIGNLGAGKTTLAKGIVEGLGVAAADDVSSPTYTIVHEYGDPVRVYHIDLYRLETVAEVLGMGIEDLLESPALLLIEWGERFPQLMPPSRTEIRIFPQAGDSRRFVVTTTAN